MSAEGESPELESWLSAKDLGVYYQGLRKAGVQKSEELSEFTEDDLKELGDKLGMPMLLRRRFIRAVNSLTPQREEENTTISNSILIPLGPDEHSALQDLGNHIETLKSAVQSTEEVSVTIKTQANECKNEIKRNFRALTKEIQKQECSALAFIDSEAEKALKQVQDNEKKTCDAVDVCNSANDDCLKALRIKGFSELSARRERILGIVQKALEQYVIQTAVEVPFKVQFSQNFSSVRNGESLVTVDVPVLKCPEIGGSGLSMDFKYEATFSTLGGSGRCGPTELGSHYSGKDHEKHVEVKNGIQTWEVARTGMYEVDAYGAEGGIGNGTGAGKGARICAQFPLESGNSLAILVGQKGGNGVTNTSSGGGGGGGTFITLNGSPLLVAAGGNGGNYINWKTPGPAGRSAHGDCGEYKRDNNISTNGRGGRGGSFKKTDDVASCRFEDISGMCFVNGGVGGVKDPNYGGCGGFGGGGGSLFGGGGGGGYFGGVVVNQNQYDSSYPHYSATSYVAKSGTLVTEADGINSGDGSLHVKFAKFS